MKNIKTIFATSIFLGSLLGASIAMAFPIPDLGGPDDPYFGPAYWACVSSCAGSCTAAGVCYTHRR